MVLFKFDSNRRSLDTGNDIQLYSYGITVRYMHAALDVSDSTNGCMGPKRISLGSLYRPPSTNTNSFSMPDALAEKAVPTVTSALNSFSSVQSFGNSVNSRARNKLAEMASWYWSGIVTEYRGVVFHDSFDDGKVLYADAQTME